MYRRLIITSLLSLSAILFASPVFAYSSPGKPTGYVNDFAHVLSDGTKQELESALSVFEASTSDEIAVAIVPSMGGDYIENYAVKLFEEWGIGKKDKDNGVLLLLSIEERKLRIEVGYGLEGALPDSLAQQIINADMTPRLKAGDYDGAVSIGVTDIMQAVKGEYQATESKSSSSLHFSFDTLLGFLLIPIFILQWLAAILARSKSWWAGGIVGIVIGAFAWLLLGLNLIFAILLIAGLGLFGLIFDYFVSKSYSHSEMRGITPPWWAGGGGFGGSSGGSFGGFGGGSSGGGGASGSW